MGTGILSQWPVGSASLRVLVVDDHPDVAETTAGVLNLWGFRTELARAGQQALQVFGAYHPHVVLLDIGLPKIDGYQLARLLRQQAGGEGVTLVAETGYADAQSRRRCPEAGFHHFLAKPVDLDVLHALLVDKEQSTPVSDSSPG